MSTDWMNATDKRFARLVEEMQQMGYGRMMQIISEIWFRIDPMGALTVGPCYGTMEKIRERCRKEGHDISHGGSYDWCDRCGAQLPKGIVFAGKKMISVAELRLMRRVLGLSDLKKPFDFPDHASWVTHIRAARREAFNLCPPTMWEEYGRDGDET